MNSSKKVAATAVAVSVCLGVATCEAGFVSGFKEGFEAGSCVVALAALGALVGWYSNKSVNGSCEVCGSAGDGSSDTTAGE